MCAPINSGGVVCGNMPTTLYEVDYALAYPAYARCVASATGPGGAPCAPGSTNANSCGRFACAEEYSDLEKAAHGFGE